MKEFQIGNIRVVFDQTQVPEVFDAVVVVLFSAGQLVLVENKQRAWEFPGGHREGHESFEESAIRETHEEAQAEITDIRYLGYYVSPPKHITVIVRAEASSLQLTDAEVGVFEQLPTPLSFGDGRERVFVEIAQAIKQAKENLNERIPLHPS
jgi:8-oxo-dGTP diphosphatase